MATMNVAVSMPPETAQVKLEMDPVSDNAQVVSLVMKPKPDTRTVAPTCAEEGLSAIALVTVTMVNVAVAKSLNVWPVTVTV